jgi:chitinase
MNLSSVFIFLFVGCLHVHAYDVSIFYCGFGGDYCGQSVDDDVHVKAKFVILAFANTQQDGSIIVDDVNFPVNLTRSWQSNGKKVFISVGGQNGNWANVFTSNSSINNFISTVTAVVSKYGLDGVDLDI